MYDAPLLIKRDWHTNMRHILGEDNFHADHTPELAHCLEVNFSFFREPSNAFSDKVAIE